MSERIARVFPRRTRATPTDELAFTDIPPLLSMPEIDEVHVSVAFTYDMQKKALPYLKRKIRRSLVRNWDIRLDEFGITRNEYRQLKYLCLDYHNMVKRLDEMRMLQSRPLDGMPHGGGPSDPTQRVATWTAELSKKVEDIEQAAIEVAPEYYQQLLDNVTIGTPWERMEIPLSRRQFYRVRRKFFYALAIRRGVV